MVIFPCLLSGDVHLDVFNRGLLHLNIIDHLRIFIIYSAQAGFHMLYLLNNNRVLLIDNMVI